MGTGGGYRHGMDQGDGRSNPILYYELARGAQTSLFRITRRPHARKCDRSDDAAKIRSDVTSFFRRKKDHITTFTHKAPNDNGGAHNNARDIMSSSSSSSRKVPSLSLAVVALSAVGGTLCCYYYLSWLRGRRRSSKGNHNDQEDHSPPETLYRTQRAGLRRISQRKGTTTGDNDKAYRDAGLHKHMQECRATQQTLRRVTDPETARRQKLQDRKLQQAAGQGPLGLSVDQLVNVRSSLRDVSNNKPQGGSIIDRT